MHRILARKFFLFSIFALGIVLGYVLGHHVASSEDDGLVETRAAGYRFIRPLLDCEIPHHKNKELRSFRDDIDQEVSACISEGLAGEISVYFRDLNNGPWFSINPEDEFVPASLLKVGVLISVLRQVEKNPGVLHNVVTVPPNFPVDWGQPIGPKELLRPGQAYTIEELLRRMITQSDNGATALLNQLLPPGSDQQTYRDLGVGFHELQNPRGFLALESYASFFRILYNASYLSREWSEYALALLSEVDYPGGIRMGVPAWVPVSQKFGHWKLPEGSPNPNQIHDVGVVYHGKRPYLLGVMTRGKDVEHLNKAIARISSKVFQEVNSQMSSR